MRIENNPVNAINSISKYTHTQELRQTENTASGEMDRVELSDSALSFSGVLRQAGGVSPMSGSDYAKRVEDVARQVKEGSYMLDPMKVADKMLALFGVRG